ncbi:GMC oxidoreductase [Bipolaris oryzae ATCC 44560]|uniref:GMC oxidoreductase n=1 Tax=Bipolaris oryzae ATCC 44560 TaxID=930090 RepID=W6ZPQ3_COCMI|nr:GMC oxidoreductase [Bipolaris oryzae ATCC 44560]EUC49459.1 GMC oxidoreductase [Bipolaris oryzae ATCC 44560]
MEPSFDYIIAGGGTAGVVIASRLKEYLPNSNIALLEAGPNAVDDPAIDNVSDPLNWMPLFQKGFLIDYSTTPQEHLGGRNIMNAAGRLLSGANGVNIGLWMRASTADLDVMAERAGNARFTYGNMEKYYKRIETHFDATADKDRYGFDGKIHTVGGRKYPIRNLLKESAENLGHKYNPTRGDPTGLGDITQCWRATSESTATRQHSAKVYDLSGVEVFCDTSVARILLDDSKRAIGVELTSGKRIMANKEVIVSCGTQVSPKILMLSGIGPADELAKHGIPQTVDSPAVGQNLCDHNAMTMYFKLKDASKVYARPFNEYADPAYGQGLPFDFGLFANIPDTELSPYLKDDGIRIDEPQEEDLLLRPNRCHYLSLAVYYPFLVDPTIFPTVKEDGAHISLCAFHMLPLSRGSVTLNSADPNDKPVCDPRFLSTNTDRFILRRAVRENLRLVETGPLAAEVEGEVPPAGAQFPALTTKSSDEEIDARITQFAGTICHPMGTCALGTVLDDAFRVKGVEGLRVCDASVLPEPIAAMPSFTIYALAEMCADLIAGKA